MCMIIGFELECVGEHSERIGIHEESVQKRSCL